MENKQEYRLVIRCKDFLHKPILNPVPYKRTTRRQLWCDEGYAVYTAWKNFLQAKMFKKYGILKIPKNTSKYKVDIKISFANKKHGDSDNVFKGVLDALFANDKFCCGTMDYRYASEGSLEIVIKELGDAYGYK